MPGVVGGIFMTIPAGALPQWRISEHWVAGDGVVTGPVEGEQARSPRTSDAFNRQRVRCFLYAPATDTEVLEVLGVGERAAAASQVLSLIIGGSFAQLPHDASAKHDVEWGWGGETRRLGWRLLHRPDESADISSPDPVSDWVVDPLRPYHPVAWQSVTCSADVSCPLSSYCAMLVGGELAAPTADVIDGVAPVMLVEAMVEMLGLRKGVEAESSAARVVAARTNAIVMAERLRTASVRCCLSLQRGDPVGPHGGDGGRHAATLRVRSLRVESTSAMAGGANGRLGSCSYLQAGGAPGGEERPQGRNPCNGRIATQRVTGET